MKIDSDHSKSLNFLNDVCGSWHPWVSVDINFVHPSFLQWKCHKLTLPGDSIMTNLLHVHCRLPLWFLWVSPSPDCGLGCPITPENALAGAAPEILPNPTPLEWLFYQLNSKIKSTFLAFLQCWERPLVLIQPPQHAEWFLDSAAWSSQMDTAGIVYPVRVRPSS